MIIWMSGNVGCSGSWEQGTTEWNWWIATSTRFHSQPFFRRAAEVSSDDRMPHDDSNEGTFHCGVGDAETIACSQAQSISHMHGLCAAGER